MFAIMEIALSEVPMGVMTMVLVSVTFVLGSTCMVMMVRLVMAGAGVGFSCSRSDLARAMARTVERNSRLDRY